MEGSLSSALLTTSLFLSSFFPQATTSAALSPLPTIGQESFRAVKHGETLNTIAMDEYQDKEKVSVILEDNPWIDNPNHIEPGWQIKIRKNPLLADTPASESAELLLASENIRPTAYPTSRPIFQAAAAFVSATPTPTAISVTRVPLPASPTSLNEEQMTFLGNCEAGMNPTRNSGNGFYGAFQFSYGTWKSMGTGYERADLAPLEVQKDAVQRLLARSSIWTQFPGCARKMHAAGLI